MFVTSRQIQTFRAPDVVAERRECWIDVRDVDVRLLAMKWSEDGRGGLALLDRARHRRWIVVARVIASAARAPDVRAHLRITSDAIDATAARLIRTGDGNEPLFGLMPAIDDELVLVDDDVHGAAAHAELGPYGFGSIAREPAPPDAKSPEARASFGALMDAYLRETEGKEIHASLLTDDTPPPFVRQVVFPPAHEPESEPECVLDDGSFAVAYAPRGCKEARERFTAAGRPTDSACACTAWPCPCACHRPPRSS